MANSSPAPGWLLARNAENRAMPSALALMVVNAQPVASRNRHQALTGSRNQSWVMVSNLTDPRPRGAGTPSCPAFHRSPRYSASTRPPSPRSSALARIHEQVAGSLGGPGPARMSCHADDVHGPGLDLHHEQDIKAMRQHGAGVQEVTGQDAGCLGGRELPPRRRRPPRRGTKPGGGQDPADRPLPRPVSQAEQLALVAPVTPAGVLPRQLLHERTHLGWDRRPSRRARVGPFLLRSGAAGGVLAAAVPRRRSRHGQPSPASGARPAAARPRPHAGAPGSPPPSRRHSVPGAPASRTPGQ